MLDQEAASTLAALLVSPLATGLLLFLDRRRLDRSARSRMWNGVTTALAVSGLFLPPWLTFGAHVWVTRADVWPLRVLKSLAGVALAYALTLVLLVAVLLPFGYHPLDDAPPPAPGKQAVPRPDPPPKAPPPFAGPPPQAAGEHK